jgi:hypothetical protein
MTAVFKNTFKCIFSLCLVQHVSPPSSTQYRDIIRSHPTLLFISRPFLLMPRTGMDGAFLIRPHSLRSCIMKLALNPTKQNIGISYKREGIRRLDCLLKFSGLKCKFLSRAPPLHVFIKNLARRGRGTRPSTVWYLPDLSSSSL